MQIPLYKEHHGAYMGYEFLKTKPIFLRPDLVRDFINKSDRGEIYDELVFEAMEEPDEEEIHSAILEIGLSLCLSRKKNIYLLIV